MTWGKKSPPRRKRLDEAMRKHKEAQDKLDKVLGELGDSVLNIKHQPITVDK